MGTVGNDLHRAHDLVSEVVYALEYWGRGQTLVAKLAWRALVDLEVAVQAMGALGVTLDDLSRDAVADVIEEADMLAAEVLG